MGNLWTGFSPAKLERVQDKVLRVVEKACEEEDAPVRFQRVHTELGASGARIHSIECESAREGSDAAAQEPIVVVHGYAAGSLLFANNMAALAHSTGRKVIAMDWLGCGSSSRPRFTAKDEHESINFFLDSFEEWRSARDITRFDMVGHSLGAYLAANYMLREGAQYVENLVLASPVGFPERPPPQPDLPRFLRGLLYLWDRGVNPGHLVRGVGPLGERMVGNFAERRFGSRTAGIKGLSVKEHGDLVSQYMHLNLAGPGSGEHSLSTILYPGAFAKLPLARTLPKVDDKNILIVFGDRDWMRRDMPAAAEAAGKLPRASVEVMAGTHHVYMNPRFNDRVAAFLNPAQASSAGP